MTLKQLVGTDGQLTPNQIAILKALTRRGR
jgi:hypothetical protein